MQTAHFSQQLPLPLATPPVAPVSEDDLAVLLALLGAHGWLTRSQLAKLTGWNERHIRQIAEAAGADVVRGQPGFKLTKQLSREDVPAGLQAADAAISQGKRMIRYGLGLRRRLHGIVG